jgi:hypothetical protein
VAVTPLWLVGSKPKRRHSRRISESAAVKGVFPGCFLFSSFP